MRVLISAFVCEPGVGSEPGAAWTWAVAAATRHDVWLVTDPRNRGTIEAQLALEPVPRLTPVYVGLPSWTGGPWQTTPGLRARYVLWQTRLAPNIRQLHTELGFDVIHHLTIGSDWLPAGVSAVEDLPLVWGPVGGCAPVLPRLWWQLGPGFLGGELARLAVTGLARKFVGEPIARRADLVVAQNRFVADRFADLADVIVETNIALASEEVERGRMPAAEGQSHTGRHAVFVGRLRPWKGLRLALEALSRPQAATWSLDVIGTGSDRKRGQRLVEQHDLADRVRFLGMLPRDEVLERLGRADALLFPSLHDAAGWVVAEALSLGCPVVCLDITGPGDLVTNDGGVRVAPRGDVVGGLADGLAALRGRVDPSDRWSADRAPELIDGWYQRALNSRRVASDRADGAGRSSDPAT
jgi:glycosyltransferase involved in cell wall biosynthesis